MCLKLVLPTEINVTVVATSGSAIAGDQYSLLCYIAINGSTNSPNITWWSNNIDITSDDTRAVSTITSVSTFGNWTYSVSNLTYTPLSASHAGTVMCRATLGNLVKTESANVSVECKALMLCIDICYVRNEMTTVNEHTYQLYIHMHLILCVVSPNYTCSLSTSTSSSDYQPSSGYYICWSIRHSDQHCGVESISGRSSDCEHSVDCTKHDIIHSH